MFVYRDKAIYVLHEMIEQQQLHRGEIKTTEVTDNMAIQGTLVATNMGKQAHVQHIHLVTVVLSFISLYIMHCTPTGQAKYFKAAK